MTAETVKSSTKAENLKIGSVLSETQYYKVSKINGSKITVVNDEGEEIDVNDRYVNACMTVADFYENEEVKTRTEIASLFLQHSHTAMTVNFNKQVKDKDVITEIQNAYDNATPKEFATKMSKAVKKGMQGEERTARGRHFGTMNEFGRIIFIDMDKEKGTNPTHDGRTIQVDPRTINWMIANGVKYIVK